MKKQLILVCVLCLFFASRVSQANNNYFIPGDAFFYFEIDQEEWERLKAGKQDVWQYDRPEHLGFFLCGYAGYANLDLGELPDEYRQRFVECVESMKETYPTRMEVKEVETGFGTTQEQTIEHNKIRIFVVNREFDFSQNRLGLKYNENWPEYAAKSGHPRKHFQYDFFVTTPKAIAESWRMGSAVPKLDVELPEGEIFIKTPIKFDPDKLQIVVAPPDPLPSLCYPSEDEELKCFAVTNDGVRVLTSTKRKGWQAQESQPPSDR